ncbi:SAM-dependent methyltransferase [Nitrospira sp.]|nr:SAM-dependent methyltransferase [Nitrospira sp.]
MSASPSIRTVSALRDVIGEYRLPRAILTALELDLFTTVGTKSWTISDLSSAMGVSARGLDILCRVLASAGLLAKTKTQYRNTRLSRTELNANSRTFRGAYLELLRNGWGDWSRLTDCVRTGTQVEDELPPDDPAYRRQFTWAMHQRSIEAAVEVARQVRISGSGTLLDLGGGPGTYALAFLDRHPRLHATICDRAPALDVAREIAATRNVRPRLSYLPLNFMEEAVPGSYDIIWYSNVLHIYSPEQNQALFRRLRSSLVPGGRLIIQDAFLRDRLGLRPMEANLFAVTMLLCTERGNTYSVGDTSRWLKDAGFRRIRTFRLKAGTGDWEGGLLEASHPR